MSHSAKAEEFMSFALILASNIVTPRVGLLLPGFAVLPAKSDSEVTFCLQSSQGLIINRSLVYLSYPQQ